MEDGGGVYKQKLYRWQIVAACDDDSDDMYTYGGAIRDHHHGADVFLVIVHIYKHVLYVRICIQDDLNFNLRRFSRKKKIQNEENAYNYS